MDPTTTTSSEASPAAVRTFDEERRMMPFLNLPAEIRNHIYHDALIKKDKPVLLKAEAPFIYEPGLLLSSKQIRNEALPIFYVNNTFESPNLATTGLFIRTTTRSKLQLLRSIHCISDEDIMITITNIMRQTPFTEYIRQFPRSSGFQVDDAAARHGWDPNDGRRSVRHGAALWAAEGSRVVAVVASE